MSWQILRPQVAEVLTGLGTLQEVSSFPSVKFNGYPAAHVSPSTNENGYSTTSENVRTYAFQVRLFYETKKKGINGALAALEKIVDSAIDAFDKEDQKGSTTRKLGIGLPAGYTFFYFFSTPSFWGEIEGEELIMAELLVRVRISIDVT